MNIPEALQEKTGEVPDFFQKLGYLVTWDYNHSGRWWEITDKDHAPVAQIDMGIPLSAIIQDFRCFREGKNKGDSDYNYQINTCPGREKEFKKLLEKVFKASSK